jgi:uncharacterized membrane protein
MSSVDETTDTDSGRMADRFTPHRLFGLSDGVFAIAMTLLALEVRIPEDVPGTADGFHEGFHDLTTSYGIFLIAFYLTGRFWLSNHRALARLHHVDIGVLNRAISFLAGICSLPVMTSVLFKFADAPEAITLSAGLLAVTALLSLRLWWYISDPRRDLMDVPSSERQLWAVKSLYAVGVYLLAIPVAFLLPAVSDLTSAWAPLVWLLLRLDNVFVNVVLRRQAR